MSETLTALGRLPDPESLRLLVLVGESGSLGSAAARLGITQPSASERLSALERRLGLVLLDRTRRGSQVTDAGRAVVEGAQRVLLELDRLVTCARCGPAGAPRSAPPRNCSASPEASNLEVAPPVPDAADDPTDPQGELGRPGGAAVRGADQVGGVHQHPPPGPGDVTRP